MPEHTLQDVQEAVAAPPGALARRFVRMLLDDETTDVAQHVKFTSGSPSPDLSLFGLDEEEQEPSETAKAPTVLAVDVASIAVLLASGFEKAPQVLRALRRDSPVVAVHLIDMDLSLVYLQVLTVCAFGRSTRIVDMARYSFLSQPDLSFTARSAAVISFDGSGTAKSAKKERALLALSLGVPVCILSSDIVRTVPDIVRRTVDDEVPVCRWTGTSLSILIEAVTGEGIDVADEPWIGAISLDDVRACVSVRRGAQPSLERLRMTVTRRLALEDAIPLLAETAGFGAARTVGLQMIGDLEAYRDGRLPWRDVARGMVLVGPPGVGKSMFSRVFARTAGLPLITASLAQWQSAGTGHLGDCLSAMRKSFQEAKAAAPAVLFIDELDSIGDRATFDVRHRDYSSQVLNALLEELDGAAGRAGVFVMGATNLLTRIDPAVIRPGRFDRVVKVELPEPRELAAILRTCLGADIPGVDLMPAAVAGRGGSGADAAAWVRRARGVARGAGRTLVLDDLVGVIGEDRGALPADVRWRVACHEAGHAVSLLALRLGTVDSLTIHASGGTTTIESAPMATTPAVAFGHLVHLLAGRAGEVVIVGTPSAGAGGSDTSDICMATRVATLMETSWGFSLDGPVWLGDVEGASTAFAATSLAPRTRRILLHAQEEAERLVRVHETEVRRLAHRLLAAGHLDGGEAAGIIGDIPVFEARPLPWRVQLAAARAS